MFCGMMAHMSVACGAGFIYGVEIVMFCVSAVVMNDGWMTHMDVSVMGIRHTTGEGNVLDCRVTAPPLVVV